MRQGDRQGDCFPLLGIHLRVSRRENLFETTVDVVRSV